MSNATQKSLLEQLDIDLTDIERRLELLDFTSADASLLFLAHPFILEEVDLLVATFLHKLSSVEEFARLIGDNESLNRFSSKLGSYITSLFSGYYDESYANGRLRIGLVHKRIGVTPKDFLSAVRLLHEILQQSLRVGLSTEKNLQATLSALDKILHFDTSLIFDMYIHALVTEIKFDAQDKAARHAALMEEKVAEHSREIEQLTRQDDLTGLLNPRAFHEELSNELARARRNTYKVTLVYLDVDDFKQLNETLGHPEGDDVLKAIGRNIQDAKRVTDHGARYGGDEFCVILPKTDAEKAETFYHRLVKNLHERYPTVNFSIGIAETGPETFDGTDDLIRKADSLMCEMKHINHKGET